MLIDSFGRTIDYLRVSVTDRCNFRCVYCMPEEGAAVSPKAWILSYEEIFRLIRIACDLGIRKVRLTGGEPLVRKDLVQLVEQISKLDVLEDLSLTTNGFLLGRDAKPLANAGLTRVNISLDTLKEERFKPLARRGSLAEVWAGIEAAIDAGLSPLKLNCVTMKQFNADEAADFARLTLERDLHVRFIELMPVNWSTGDDTGYTPPPSSLGNFVEIDKQSFADTFNFDSRSSPSRMLNALEMHRNYVSSVDTRALIESELGTLEPAELMTNGPAKSFRVKGGMGTVGFISQISSDLCKNCNRIRLTADGQLRPCLMAEGEIDLRKALRTGASDTEIGKLFETAVYHKPFEHRIEEGISPHDRSMSQIGG